MTAFKVFCQQCLNFRTNRGRNFGRAMGLLNLVFIGLLIYEIIYGSSPIIKALELSLGVIFAIELGTRFWVDKHKAKFFFDWFNFIDLVVIVAVFGKYLVYDTLLLQLVSALRLLRSYRVLSELSQQNRQVFYYYETLKNLLTLLLFIFIMSGVVFTLLGAKNDSINNFTDALYFTITTLTTTGFGDITVQDRSDKLLVIFIMIVGASIFLKLATSLFRAKKVFYECEECGLTHHEVDASHCKHCGEVVHIKTKGMQ